MTTKTPQCHTCPYDGKKSAKCHNCPTAEQYSYKHNLYILDEYDPIQPDTSGSAPVTTLSEEAEDTLRKFFYTLFDLQPLELLCLKAIMNGQSLVDWSEDISKILKKPMTRFHAFQLRKSMLKKLGDKYAPALITKGQRKPLKKTVKKETRKTK